MAYEIEYHWCTLYMWEGLGAVAPSDHTAIVVPLHARVLVAFANLAVAGS